MFAFCCFLAARARNNEICIFENFSEFCETQATPDFPVNLKAAYVCFAAIHCVFAEKRVIIAMAAEAKVHLS